MSFVGAWDEQRLRNDVTHAANQLQQFHIIHIFFRNSLEQFMYKTRLEIVHVQKILNIIHQLHCVEHCCCVDIALKISLNVWLWPHFYWRCHFGRLSYGEEGSTCESQRKRMFEIPKWICEPKYTAEIIIDCGNSTGQIPSQASPSPLSFSLSVALDHPLFCVCVERLFGICQGKCWTLISENMQEYPVENQIIHIVIIWALFFFLSLLVRPMIFQWYILCFSMLNVWIFLLLVVCEFVTSCWCDYDFDYSHIFILIQCVRCVCCFPWCWRYFLSWGDLGFLDISLWHW